MLHWIEMQWQKSGWGRWILWPLSILFACLSKLRRFFYRIHVLKTKHLPVPVIVIGNISVGGVGKTPLVLYLAHALSEAGYRPGILSRGYGGENTGEVLPDSHPQSMGDEPVLLRQRARCPVWVDPDRYRGGLALLKSHHECNVLICDDGLQHYALARDFEIAVVQRPYGLGNGCLLPAGPLREPLSRLTEVNAIVESGELPQSLIKQESYQLSLHMNQWTALSNPEAHITYQSLKQQSLFVVAGIGHPQRFFDMLRGLGLTFEHKVFPDHHFFTQDDFHATSGKAILMTEKDAVKCRYLSLENAWYLPVSADVQPIHHSSSLLNQVIHVLQQYKGK